jgi:hypothetical protein
MNVTLFTREHVTQSCCLKVQETPEPALSKQFPTFLQVNCLKDVLFKKFVWAPLQVLGNKAAA